MVISEDVESSHTDIKMFFIVYRDVTLESWNINYRQTILNQEVQFYKPFIDQNLVKNEIAKDVNILFK